MEIKTGKGFLTTRPTQRPARLFNPDDVPSPHSCKFLRVAAACAALKLSPGDLVLVDSTLGSQDAPPLYLVYSNAEGEITLQEAIETDVIAGEAENGMTLVGELVQAFPGGQGMRYIRNVRAIRRGAINRQVAG